MIRSHYDPYTDDYFEYYGHPPMVINQQGVPGPGPYGAPPAPAFYVPYWPRRRMPTTDPKVVMVIGVFLMVVSIVLLICGVLVSTGVIACNPFTESGLQWILFTSGAFIFVVGFSVFTVALYEMKKRNNQQRQTTESDHLIGPYQPRSSPPNQP